MRSNTENSNGKPCLIHIISLLDGRNAGKKRRNDKSDQSAENNRKNNAENAEPDVSQTELSDGITEQKVTDKGANEVENMVMCRFLRTG